MEKKKSSQFAQAKGQPYSGQAATWQPHGRERNIKKKKPKVPETYIYVLANFLTKGIGGKKRERYVFLGQESEKWADPTEPLDGLQDSS